MLKTIASNIITVLLVFFAQATFAETTMQTESLRVDVDEHLNEFHVFKNGADTPFVKHGQFAAGMKDVEKSSLNHPAWGQGQEILVKHDNQWITKIRVFENHPFVHLHTTVVNNDRHAYVTPSQPILQFDANLGVDSDRLRSYGTGGLHDIGDAPGSFSFAAVVDSQTRNGVVSAFLTHERGSGVFETMQYRAQARVRARIDFGRYQVLPGHTRKTETILLGFFDDARRGLEAYAEAVAEYYKINLPPQPSVYCTWYHAGSSTQEKLLQNASFAQTHLKPHGLSVMQIDDRWQDPFPAGINTKKDKKEIDDGGPVKVFVEANENFPRGMEYTARQLKQYGVTPGIWFMPFAGNYKNPYFMDKQALFAKNPDGTPFTTRWSGTILDLSHPKTQEFVYNRVKRIADWGYGYFKLDGMHTGAVTHNVYVNSGYSTSGRWQNKKDFGGGVLHDPAMTHIQAYRKGLDIVRDAAPDVFILGCNVSQNMRSMGAAFDKIDAMRIGPDNGGAGQGRWDQVKVGAWHGTNLYFLNRRVWHNDPDPVYVRPSNPLHAARLMVSWLAVSGNMLTTSYQFADFPPERLDLLKRCMPSHAAQARPVDLLERDQAAIWLVRDTKSGVKRYVVGLFNWKEKENETITYDMGKLGLDPKKEYVAFEYWSNKYIGTLKETLRQTLPAGSCRILALREKADHPQVLSTSRHITQGIVDVLREDWDAESKVLSGKSQVVKGEPYEIRIILPREGKRKVKDCKIKFGQIALTPTEDAPDLVRIGIIPARKTIHWRVQFE